MRPVVIGLAGFAQTGKDSLADGLVEEGYQKIGFADGVRAFMDELDPALVWGSPEGYWETSSIPWSEAVEVYGYEWTKIHTNARDWMVKVGAGARRAIGPTVWVDRVEKILREDPWGRYVVADVRYPNEAEMISNLGGEVWRIHRPGIEAANIEEEISLLDIEAHREVVNSGTVEQLREWASW